jgi:serine protease Do
MSFLLVGMVGAIIGGLLVIGIAPQVPMSRAGLTALSSGSPVQSSPGTGDRTPTTSLTFTGDPWQNVVAVAETVSPAVVGIVNQQGGLYDFFGREYSRDTSGSGLIVTSDGYIVTNNHVVENQKSLTVYLADGRSLKARVVGTDPRTDLAVVKVDATGLPTGVFGDSDQLRAGELAVAIGNPLGMDFSRTVTAGVVSGLNRVIDISDEAAVRLIQTDAVINPGNSGGPLVNARGEVIGLTSMKLVTENVEGMGFAIPSNMVKRVATEIMKTGVVKRAQIGVNLVDAEAAAKQYSLRVDRGAYVAEVTGVPAQKAGLKAGDVIVALDGTVVNSTSTLRALLAEKSPGDKVTLKVVRGSQDLTLEVVLGQATR